MNELKEYENLLKNNKNMDDQTKKDANKNILQLKKKRYNKCVEPKIFCQFVICENYFIDLPEQNEQVENLFLLTSNRKMENIFLMTSSYVKSIVAINLGFCVIPI
jgi:hypothetical protein